MSYVRGVPVDFSAAKIKEVLKIRFLTPGAETDFKTRQMEDQRLDEVIRDICVPRARWKMSSSQPDQPIQLKRVEELIADNIAIIAEAAQGRSKLSFSSTIFSLCKEAGVSMARPTKSNTKSSNKASNNKGSNNFKTSSNNIFSK
ncbi:hypothetical protein PIB30_082037 [Stylosanthes scabra]|uniref:Uncharacterized protein n=1 Tax=Stylosanthes scabra TaxID=79078 RepID=A0ABU6YPH1_9FABA|nr:hypothetical protein [Stylosanthes scabra]